MFALFVYQNVYLSRNEPDNVASDWSKYIKALYLVGLCGPILNWIFIFFLVTRLNEKMRSQSNPAFLDTADNEDMGDNDKEAMLNHSGEISPVVFDDLRRNYSRPL